MKTKHLLLTFMLSLSLMSFNSLEAQTIYYVKESGAGNLNGSSWANASDDLQAMINKAGAGDQIWVAAGGYFPTKASNHLAGTVNPLNRNNAFYLKKDVKVYGSFPADANDKEHTSIDVRFPDGRIVTSYLIGALKENPTWDDVAYHVVISAGDIGSAELNGFVVANGNANGSSDDEITVNDCSISNSDGGGICCIESSPIFYCVVVQQNKGKYGAGLYIQQGSPLISHSTVEYNSADEYGGGIYNFWYSSPTIFESRIQESSAGINGGGINNHAYSSPIITNCSILNCEANMGGGMYNTGNSAPIMDNLDITNNRANFGGGIYNYKAGKVFFKNGIINKNRATEGAGGGIINVDCEPVFLNSLIVENTAKMGGAGAQNGLGANPYFINVTISRNISDKITTGGTSVNISGGAMRNSNDAKPRIYNSIIYGNLGSPQIYSKDNASVIMGASTEENPNFIGGSETDYNYNIKANSLCIDAGKNSYYSDYSGGDLYTDLDYVKNPRLQGASIDIGAYEYNSGTDISEIKKENISIYPNPASDYIIIKGIEIGETIQMYNINGDLVYTCKIKKDLEEIGVTFLPTGIYLIKTSMGKIIKWMKN